MNFTIQKRIIQIIVPIVVDILLDMVTLERFYAFKKKLFEKGKEITEKIPGKVDDYIWEHAAGILLFEGVYKENEDRFITWLENYRCILKDETFRVIVASLIRRLKELQEEGNRVGAGTGTGTDGDTGGN